MAGLDPAIHCGTEVAGKRLFRNLGGVGMAGSSPAMTEVGLHALRQSFRYRCDVCATVNGAYFSAFAASITSAAWPVTLTLRHTLAILPDLSTRNVLRSMPIYFRPYIDFSTQVS